MSLHVIQLDLLIHTLDYRHKKKTDENLNDNYIMMSTHANFNVSKIKFISFFRFSRNLVHTTLGRVSRGGWGVYSWELVLLVSEQTLLEN